MMQQKPSAAERFSPTGSEHQAPLMAAGLKLAERGMLGLLWVGDDLKITARFGGLVDFSDVGEPLTSSLLPLVGLEDEIASLKNNANATLELPAVTLATLTRPVPKINIQVFWSSDEQCFLVLVTPYSGSSGLELELSRQIRARLIAESELQHKSKALEQANHDLARANRDLEDYASIISHDLKAPMRHLRYMIDDVEQMLASTMSNEAAERLDGIRQQSLRMSGMLTALLDYASAGRKDEVAEVVDTRALLDAIVQSLNVPQGLAIEVSGNWPKIRTHAAALDLVLRNLIDNALKHHDKAEGSVRITCHEDEDGLTIHIQDDGPGIPQSALTAIFNPFRKLGPENTESHGMGLAFAAKWVGAIGGSLSARSNPEEEPGSVFELGWPKLQHNQET